MLDHDSTADASAKDSAHTIVTYSTGAWCTMCCAYVHGATSQP